MNPYVLEFYRLNGVPAAAVAADHDFFCLGCQQPYTNIDELTAHDLCPAPFLARPHATHEAPAKAGKQPQAYAAVR